MTLAKQTAEEFRVLRKLTEDKQHEALSMQVDKLECNGIGHVIGTCWDCPESELGLCVYDHVEDRAHDYCLFCGQPEERK